MAARARGTSLLPAWKRIFPAWKDRLSALGVAIEAEVAWPGGGRSIYIRDPAGNSVELVTPQIWRLGG